MLKCEKWDFRIANFVKNWDFHNGNFWIIWGFLPQCVLLKINSTDENWIQSKRSDLDFSFCQVPSYLLGKTVLEIYHATKGNDLSWFYFNDVAVE